MSTSPIIYEFEVLNTQSAIMPLGDLAVGGKFSASSTTTDAAQGASSAFDSREDTRWQACDTCRSDEWLEVEFPAPRVLDTILVSAAAAAGTEPFVVEYRSQGKWFEAHDATGEDLEPGLASIEFLAVRADALRLRFVGAEASPSIVNLGVFRNNDDEPRSDAEEPNLAEPSIKLSQSTVNAGDRLIIDGVGFEPGAALRVDLHSDPVLLGEVTVDTSGTFSLNATIPSETSAGMHEVVVLDARDTLASMPLSVVVAADGAPDGSDGPGVDGHGGGGSLAATGRSLLNALAPALLGAGLLVVGGILFARRRAATR